MAEGKRESEEAVEPDSPMDNSGVGVSITLDQARAHPELNDEVRAFLQDQRSLIAVHKHHLHERFKRRPTGRTWTG